MYRWRLADEPLYPDRFGDYHEDRAQMRDTNPRGGEDEVCPVCSKPVVAREHCGSCGDPEDMAA